MTAVDGVCERTHIIVKWRQSTGDTHRDSKTTILHLVYLAPMPIFSASNGPCILALWAVVGTHK